MLAHSFKTAKNAAKIPSCETLLVAGATSLSAIDFELLINEGI